jgi:soluble lytic murein transglycosylase-like protein
LKPLPESAAITATDNIMTEHQRRVLNRYTAPANTNVAHNNRALGVTQQFMPEVVPNGYGKYIAESGAKHGVNPIYIAALGEIESGFNPNAPSYNNSSFGVMQINRSAHPAFFAEQNWKDPQTNIDYGSRYYSEQLQRFGDPIAAAMAYNAGPEDYQRYLDGTLPDGPKKREMLAHGAEVQESYV